MQWGRGLWWGVKDFAEKVVFQKGFEGHEGGSTPHVLQEEILGVRERMGEGTEPVESLALPSWRKANRDRML